MSSNTALVYETVNGSLETMYTENGARNIRLIDALTNDHSNRCHKELDDDYVMSGANCAKNNHEYGYHRQI